MILIIGKRASCFESLVHHFFINLSIFYNMFLSKRHSQNSQATFGLRPSLAMIGMHGLVYIIGPIFIQSGQKQTDKFCEI